MESIPAFLERIISCLSLRACIKLLSSCTRYEALIFLVMYALYITIMYFNRRLEKKAYSIFDRICKKELRPEESETEPLIRSHELEDSQKVYESSAPKEVTAEAETSLLKQAETSLSKNLMPGEEKTDGDPEYESPWTIPDKFLSRVFWVAMIPVKALLYFTTPDCRRPGIWRKLYMLTFVMSVFWIAAFSYVMVWMVVIAGDALGIPDTVMGLTLLAAGTSVPDCLASLFAARDGFGDMAVSNSIGSNVFDILACLGVPWLIDTIVNGKPISIRSGGLVYSAVTLLATVVYMLLGMFILKWKLNKKFGALCLIVYVIVTTITCLFELNIIGNFNEDKCT
ncbi:hypothetical protein CHS0354_015698 [Potamilus streckersoni]|uniref:Sodium/calcium exchanger membrane region domain-containing protein n=1 Tax=Potamilus streckersoni TaxID=2493646 RepID=A0AAE0SSA6_9BIVA|nr:hypothetical protein CHS0354_015698 [Potamilus streckersoni]